MKPDDLDPATKARIEAEYAEEMFSARVIGVQPKPGRYHVYLDESENVEDQLYVVAIVLVHDSALYQLNRDVDKIRAKIRRNLIKNSYPIFIDGMELFKSSTGKSEAERLRSGGLPEIHAQHMWQGNGAYRKKGSVDTMRLRNKWLKSIAKIFDEHRIYSMTRKFDGKLKSYITADAERVLNGCIQEKIYRQKELVNSITIFISVSFWRCLLSWIHYQKQVSKSLQ